MGLFRKTADQIKAMMDALTFSQKALIVSLVVIIIGCVAWMMNYAGSPEWTPVINQSFDSATLAKQAAALKAAGIKSQVKDGKVQVRQSEQEQALAVLAYSGDLAGQDISFGFEQVVNDSNIWRSESEKERMWKVATENELARVVRLFPGVQEAKVIVDRPEKSGFGRLADSTGSAAVHVRLKGGASIDKKMILAVADFVAGSVREIPRERVRLVDSTNGRSYRVPSDESSVPADLLELTMLHEKHLTDNIVKAVGHIENVMISVSVKVDPAGKTIKAFTPDKATTITPVREESGSKSSSTDGGAGGEPGVTPNTGTAVAANGGSAGPRRAESEDKTIYGDPIVGTKETLTTEPAGAVQDVSAAVNIPRSYFVSAMKAAGQAEPTPDAVKQFIAEQSEQIKEKVMRAVGLAKADEGKVVIGWYYDTATAATAEAPAAKSAGMMAALTGNARTVGLGALALVSLVVMLMMMRKAASGVTIAANEPMLAGAGAMSMGSAGGSAIAAGTPPAMLAGETVVGEAGVADGYLQGMEVDEETLRTQKMVEQVATMVKENPDAAANLVRRWVAKKQK